MTGYAITDENKSLWVRQDANGAYSLTTDHNRALIFDSKVAADTVFKSNLSKLIKSKGVAVKSVSLQIDSEKKKNTVKKISNEVVVTPTGDVDSAKYIISVLSEAAAKLNCRHTSLADEQSKYDRQVSDVEHYIEFNAGKLNAAEGYKAYKLLQDVLVRRRKVKDELQIISAVMDRVSVPDDLDAKISQLESRKYEPREFKYLFEEKEQ